MSTRAILTGVVGTVRFCHICRRTIHGRYNLRCYSSEPSGSGGGIIKTFLENLKKNIEKNKEMQESLKAFEDERNRIVRTDAVKLFKQKISGVQERILTITIASFDAFKSSIARLTKVFQRASESEMAKKGQEIGTKVTMTAQYTATKLSEKAQVLEKTNVYKTVSKGAETVKEDLIDDIIHDSAPYQQPEKILKRSERSSNSSEPHSVITEDDDTKDVTVTKRSKWSEGWDRLRTNNPVSNLFYSLRMKYDESDNIMVRLSRNVTDKVGDAFSGVLTQSDMSETLAEIRKLDPNFDKETFIRECRYEIIPTVLEAFLQGKDDILKDWCHEAAYNVLSAIIKQKSTNAATSKVLEVQNVDILGAKVLEQGPVMILTFTAQQLTFDDTSNENRSLTKDLLENVVYVWALCRDQTIYDSKSAWRVLEFGIQSSGHLLV